MALVNIQKLMGSHRTNFEGGVQGFQSYCAQAIESYLHLVVNGNQNGILASETDAEWFINAAGEKTMQAMIFPTDHPNNPDQPKGMKQVLMEQGPCQPGLKYKKPICHSDATPCGATCML